MRRYDQLPAACAKHAVEPWVAAPEESLGRKLKQEQQLKVQKGRWHPPTEEDLAYEVERATAVALEARADEGGRVILTNPPPVSADNP